MTRAPIAVLGLGNELFTDEGLGVAGSRLVAALGLPGVDVLDGGTLGIALLPEIEGREALLVLDAVIGGLHHPAEIVELAAEDLLRSNLLMYSAHQIGLPETLAAARLTGRAPELLAGVGIVPVSLETGYGLSPEVEEQVPGMVERALEILSSWGVEMPVSA